MSDYRITCTIQEPTTEPPGHAHIVQVGTGGDTGWSRKWTREEVVRAIKDGWHTFHTIGTRTRRRAEVRVIQCPAHPWHETLTTVGDTTLDNNLDSLPRCTN
ncbi:MAG: DUF3892 domain-containing protein [Actinomycetota bacterium]|nr:DUF3892 domain-containing protein [Actinomycetota bacterium]